MPDRKLKNIFQDVRKEHHIESAKLEEDDQPEDNLKAALGRLMPEKLLRRNGGRRCPQKGRKVQQALGHTQQASFGRQFIQGIQCETDNVDRQKVGPQQPDMKTISEQEKKKGENGGTDQSVTEKSAVYGTRSILNRQSPAPSPSFISSLIRRIASSSEIFTQLFS